MQVNQTVKIISDSTCDLSQELVEKYDIDILPLHILLGDAEYRDGKDISPDSIFSWADANKATPKTSAPSLEDAVTLLRPYVAEGREVICFSISGSMSTSGNVMRLAAEELEAGNLVTVIDSANLSTGIGHLVVEAAMKKSKEDVYHAVYMDPLTSAVCSLDEIKSMCDELFEINKDYLGEYK